MLSMARAPKTAARKAPTQARAQETVEAILALLKARLGDRPKETLA